MKRILFTLTGVFTTMPVMQKYQTLSYLKQPSDSIRVYDLFDIKFN